MIKIKRKKKIALFSKKKKKKKKLQLQLLVVPSLKKSRIFRHTDTFKKKKNTTL
jgi:hypothetical protein